MTQTVQKYHSFEHHSKLTPHEQEWLKQKMNIKRHSFFLVRSIKRVNAIISLSKIKCSSKIMSNNKIIIMNSKVIIQLRLHTRHKRSLWGPLTNQTGQWTIKALEKIWSRPSHLTSCIPSRSTSTTTPTTIPTTASTTTTPISTTIAPPTATSVLIATRAFAIRRNLKCLI